MNKALEAEYKQWISVGISLCTRMWEGCRHENKDWYDHRLDWMLMLSTCNDFWVGSVYNPLLVLPMGGSMLDLCCGDGFYLYHFFRQRARSIVGVDIGQAVIEHAKRLHSAPNIAYIIADVLTYQPTELYDVVWCRSAIEHFTADEQQVVFGVARKALKSGGWFCGDTPLNPSATKMLAAHECEWPTVDAARAALSQAFKTVNLIVLESVERTTLFWKCQ